MSNETVPRYCSNCRHLYRRGPSQPSSQWVCTAPQGQKLDLVTGLLRMAWDGQCANLRIIDDLCGNQGKWFEAVDEPQEGSK